jgi:adenylate cyclase 10
LPEIVKTHIFNVIDHFDATLKLPLSMEFKSVSLFCDVSGFTNLSEHLSRKGAVGAEELGFYLNQYLEMMAAVIADSGGDVFKFAGDAMLVLYPPQALMERKKSSSAGSGNVLHPDITMGRNTTIKVSDDELANMVHRAGQCCAKIQAEMGDVRLADGVRLRVKLGMGVGSCNVLLVGGVFSRIEYLACGEPLSQAFASEGECTSGDVVMSTECWKMVPNKFKGRKINAASVKVEGILESIENKPIASSNPGFTTKEYVRAMKRIVPAAVLPQLAITSKIWQGELRQVSIVFISLGLNVSALANMNKENIDFVVCGATALVVFMLCTLDVAPANLAINMQLHTLRE